MNMKKILEVVAAQNNTTVAEVRTEMEAAIASAKDNPNFRQAFGGRIPSIEEFILYAVLQCAPSSENQPSFVSTSLTRSE